MTRVRSTGVTMALVTAIGAPLLAAGVWVFAASEESPLQAATPAAPLMGTVETAQRSGETNVSVKVQYATALSPTTQASGTVTAMHASGGSDVTHGDLLMVVDAAEVFAYAADAPLFRDVSRGSDGTDVAIAQQLLIDLGYLEGEPDGDAGYVTEQAIKKFNEEHGYGKNNTVLSRAAVVWIGPSAATVDEMVVAVGDSVSPGTAVFSTTASMSAIEVTEPPTMSADGPLVLDVGGTVVDYEAGSGYVTDPESVALIADALGDLGEGVGLTRLATPTEVASVPAPAVVTDDTGRTCIFPDLTGDAVPITPLGGTLGTVDVDLALAGEPLLLNPREVRETIACD